MDKRIMHSPDLVARNIERIAELFPTVVTETRDEDGNVTTAIDFDLLRQELSDHIVEGPQERYRLDWPGKRAAAFAANAPIAKTLRPVREESVDFDTTKNIFIEGDNLDALKLLQESYLGKVKLIYIDPPYNTGNDFIYKDDFSETVEEYLVRSGQRADGQGRLVANTESAGRFHSSWLSMIYPRLKLARSFLSDEGVIFVSIDDNEVAQLRRVMDELYGEDNFVAQVVWQKRTSPEARKRLGAGHEYVIVYARDARNLENALQSLPLDDKDRESFGNPDNDPRGPWVSSDFTAPGYRPNQMYEIVTPSGLKVAPPPGRCWMNLEDEYRKQFEQGRFWFGSDGKGVPRRKTYLYEREGKSAWTWWPHVEVGSTQEGTREVRSLVGDQGFAGFDFPKPVRLVQRIVQLATRADRGDLVMDFFAGSGTTAHAVMAQNALDGGNREFLLVQLAENLGSRAGEASLGTIAGFSRRRVISAAEKVFELSAVVPGFRLFRVDESGVENVFRVPNEISQLSLQGLRGSIKPDRTAEDLLFQVILDWGLELSLPISRDEVDGREVHDVDDGALIACFAEAVTPAVVRAIAERGPLRAVFRDDAFASDAARINAEQIFRELSPGTEVRTI